MAALVIGVGVALGSAVTGLATVSHYKAEHANALRARNEHSALVGDRDRVARLLDASRSRADDLAAKLGRTRSDVRYAVGRITRLQTRLSSAQAQASALRDALAAAKVDAKTSYMEGYNAGLADGSAASPSPGGDCDENYEGACVPTDQGDVDCGDLLETDFDVVGVDVDGLDGDGDGIACESY